MSRPRPTRQHGLGMLPAFNDWSFYSAHFTDIAIWEPVIREVCGRHGITCRSIHTAVPGSFPTFIISQSPSQHGYADGQVVLKFFGPLFDGAGSYHREADIGRWLHQVSLPIRSPEVLWEGELSPGWWYIAFEYIPGVSIGQVRGRLSEADWSGVASLVGDYLHCFHTTGIPPGLGFETANKAGSTWQGYSDFLSCQRHLCTTNHRTWGDLPSGWVAQLDEFVLPVEALIDQAASPHLIHADLTADHLLGRLVDGRWETLAVIDWGDAMIGNILYELVALYLDLLQGDSRLLNICLSVYDLPQFFRADFSRRALSLVLLHQFPMPARFYAPYQHLESLQAAAKAIFPFY